MSIIGDANSLTNIGDWGGWDWANGLVSGGGNQILGGTIGNPFSGITDAMGYRNPNSSKEGAALNAQRGDLVSWGSTAADANRIFGQDVNAPQVGKVGWTVTGTDPNGQPIYGRTGASVEAPTWQQAQVSQAGAVNAGAATAAATPQMQAAAMEANAANAATMSGAQLDLAQANQARANQNALVSSLQGTAAGQGPSIAQEQLRQATDQNINAQTSLAQSAHGANRLAAMRAAARNQAAIQQQAASQSSALRAQEIAAAQSNLGSTLGMQRGVDVNAAVANAGLSQQTGATNAAMQQQANILNAQLGQQAGATNAGFAQQAGLANMETQQQRNIFNAQQQQGANIFNAGQQQGTNQYNANALNTSALNFAQQQNAGNLSLANANLLAQQQTNMLNTQRGNYLIGAEQNAAQGQTDINKTKFEATAGYDADKRKQTTDIGGSILDNVGGLVSLGGLI
jgi:hypothetical protein